jgi:UDP-glucose 4-epimerase
LNVLVVGGAGYIGSHMVKHLLRAGIDTTTLDNLSTGYRDAIVGGTLVEGDCSDPALLDRVLGSRRFDAVMHFASCIQVGESVRDPAKYYANNVVSTLVLLDTMRRHGVGRFVFSSAAAVYGNPRTTPIPEEHPKEPINPYGRTKWVVEQVLDDYDRAYGMKSVRLRYFNAAGADPDGKLGERHVPETHLIPLVLQAASGRREAITVFGRDYATPDGTCIRDYVHVEDLCDAHLLALRRLAAGGGSAAYNLGNGLGFSVKEVIGVARWVTGREIPVRYGERRDGDPPVLVADAARAKSELGWKPGLFELETIVRHAWAWELRERTSP